VSRYQKGKINLDFTEARESEWQWHQLGHMQVCTSLQSDNHASTPLLSFLQAGCPSCRPTNSVKALKAYNINKQAYIWCRNHKWNQGRIVLQSLHRAPLWLLLLQTVIMQTVSNELRKVELRNTELG